jgi:hypothetical protein
MMTRDSSPFSSPLSRSLSLSSHDFIHQLSPAVIPRVSAIANMAWCERAAYNISFFGVESDSYLDGAGEIGSAVHRIVIKSILEIVNLIKNAAHENDNNKFSKADAMKIFMSNAQEEVDLNWKRYALAGIEQPLPIIMHDLDIRADRLSSEIVSSVDSEKKKKNKNNNYKKIIFRPEFTIRNKDIPLEGRLDLLKVELENESPLQSSKKYVAADDLINAKIKDIEIIQIKTGKAVPRSPRVYMQADAEALLLMQTLKLKTPPKYTWQFADKDIQHKKFNFAKVREAVDNYIKIWKAEQSPEITGYCPKCSLKNACRDWYFARSDKLSDQDLVRRRAAFKLSKTLREEIADTDKWKIYVSFRNAKERHEDGWAITGLKVDTDKIDTINQEVVLVGVDGSFGNFVDFSVGDFVTVSDGNPNLGSNPTAIITAIDLKRPSVKIQSIKNDLYVLTYDNRQNSILTMDRFDFDKGLTTIRYLDSFYRQSPYADIILESYATAATAAETSGGRGGGEGGESSLSQQQSEDEEKEERYM